ncbi:hypothetical protein ABK040_009000 [Willaertia magna]
MNTQILPTCFFLNNSFPSIDPIKFIRYDRYKGIICTENKIYELDYSSRSVDFNEIKKLESINKFMDYSNGHIIIVNELNEFYFKDNREVCDFTKTNILFNENIKQFNMCVFFFDDENNIYLCGGETDLDDYGIILKDESLWKFTKIDLKLNKKYLQIIPLEEFTLFIGTDYKINKEDEDDNILGEKCFKVLQNEKLVDVNIYCNFYNLKKRKRNEFNL